MPARGQLRGHHRDARSERRPRPELGLHGHGRRLGQGPGGQRAWAPPTAGASPPSRPASASPTPPSPTSAPAAPDANTYISETDNGEVTLKPTVGEEFSGSSVPAGWTSCPWTTSEPPCPPGATVSDGALHANGAYARTDTAYPAGRALEFKATFNAIPFETAGFATDLNAAPWATFSTKSDGNTLFTRTDNGQSGGQQETDLGSGLLGSPHLFRIEWGTSDVKFYVDGSLVATHTVTFPQNLRVIASEFNSGGPELTVDWMRMSPYPGSGAFTSRVFDAGQAADWGALTWNSAAPSGTGVALSVRTGNTPTPDGTWSSFTPIASSGGDIPNNSRYVQYRAQLNSGDPARTPVLSDVSIGYAPGADTTAPTISGRTPSPNATGVDPSGNVQVQFSEPMDAATINGSSIRLRKQGAGSDVPATVSYAGNTATLNPSSDLDPNGVYTVTVAGSVADQSGNQLGADDTWSFTTSPPIQNLVDTTVSDFSAGAPDANTYVSKTDDGEVTLQPTEGQEFSGGPGVPAGWQVSPWDLPSSGGSATVTGGQLVLNGAAAGPTQTYAAGHALEVKATFSGATFQHVGFGVDFNTQPYWAMFSIKGDGHLYARTNNNNAVTETQLSDSLIGSAHVFRVEWTATEVRYYVDGSLVATHTASIAVQMRPLASDLFNGDAGTVSVDWLRMSPYPGSGTFTSRVFDGTQTVNWKGLNWTAASPAGTGIALSVRTGDTPTPDGSWTSFAQLSGPGAQINASSRYLQYQAVLTSSDPNQTPTLNDVSIGYVAPPDTTAPTISQRTPSPNAVNVAPNGNVQVQFSEPMNPATIDGSTIRLRKQGAGSDVPASVTYSGNTATLDPSADLDFNSVYTVTVAGTVADQSGNQLGADDTWSFTTAPHTFGFTDTTVGDFGGGSPDANTYVSQTDNGELILKPTEGQEFSGGPGLPAGWDSSNWDGGGSATVSSGQLRVNGSRASTTATYPAGRSLEFKSRRSVPGPSSTWASPRTTSPAISTRSSALATRPTRFAPARTSEAASSPSRSQGSRRARRISTGSSGTPARSATTSTGRWSPPTPAASGPTCVRPSATAARRPPSSPSTGCG